MAKILGVTLAEREEGYPAVSRFDYGGYEQVSIVFEIKGHFFLVYGDWDEANMQPLTLTLAELNEEDATTDPTKYKKELFVQEGGFDDDDRTESEAGEENVRRRSVASRHATPHRSDDDGDS